VNDELALLREAVEHRAQVIRDEDLAVDEAVLAAYRAKADNDMPANTLAEIGAVLGVSRQRAYQIVREVAARAI
jgi:hypothetical protein